MAVAILSSILTSILNSTLSPISSLILWPSIRLSQFWHQSGPSSLAAGKNLQNRKRTSPDSPSLRLHGKKFGAAAAFVVVALPLHGFNSCSATFETEVASKSGKALLTCMLRSQSRERSGTKPAVHWLRSRTVAVTKLWYRSRPTLWGNEAFPK